MKRINDLLPHAMAALLDSGLLFHHPPASTSESNLPQAQEDADLLPKNSILDKYDGYVASFAPSVITAGLRATLSFYSDTHKDKHNGEPRRNHMLALLQSIYYKMHPVAEGSTGADLLSLALQPGTDQRQLKKDLVDCAIALKLVLRNFEQVAARPAPATNTPPVHETEVQP